MRLRTARFHSREISDALIRGMTGLLSTAVYNYLQLSTTENCLQSLGSGSFTKRVSHANTHHLRTVVSVSSSNGLLRSTTHSRNVPTCGRTRQQFRDQSAAGRPYIGEDGGAGDGGGGLGAACVSGDSGSRSVSTSRRKWRHVHHYALARAQHKRDDKLDGEPHLHAL